MAATHFMDTLIQIIFRIALFFIGLMFFMLLVFIGLVLAGLWLLRSLWYKITGKPRPTFSAFRFTPRQGFDFFYGRAGQNPPRPSQRAMDDVVDIEVKSDPKHGDDDPPHQINR